MKLVSLVVAALVALVSSEAPYPPSGTRPQGALLVLPSEALGRQYGAPHQPSYTTDVQKSISLDRLSEEITERLRQQEGAQSGAYYVQVQDGRLQNVRYTSAPLRARPSQNNQQVNVQNSQSFANSNTFQFNQQNAQANSKFQGYTQGPAESDESRQAFSQLRQENPSGPQQNSGYSRESMSGQYRQNAATNQFNQPAASNQFIQQSAQQVSQYGSSGRYTQPAQIEQFSQQSARNQYTEGAASNQYKETLPGRRPAQQVQPSPARPNTNAKQLAPETPADQPEASSDSETKEATTPAPQLQQDSTQQQQIYQTQLLQQHFLQPQFVQAQLLQPQSVQIQHQVEVQQEQWPATYLASIHYTDVQPIAAPIYSYPSAPLVRVLRYAPKHQ